MQDQLLNTPVEQLTGVDFVLRRAGQLMNPPELLHLVTHAAQNAKYLAFERQLVNTAWHCIGAIQVLSSGSGRDADGPGSAILSGDGRRTGHVAHPRMDDLRWGNVDTNLADKTPV